MGFKFSKPLKYGIKKKEQSAMKRIMSVKKNLSKQDSINRVEKNYGDELNRISPKVSPTARIMNTFGSKKVIK
jgi:hypothetical protein|tara:strand:+ start:152 stop:370 length:219 start_codon:yes stop_codon:yes gene_type:complete